MISPFVFNGSPPGQAAAKLHRIGTLRQPLHPVAGVSVGRRVVGCRNPLGTSGYFAAGSLFAAYRKGSLHSNETVNKDTRLLLPWSSLSEKTSHTLLEAPAADQNVIATSIGRHLKYPLRRITPLPCRCARCMKRPFCGRSRCRINGPVGIERALC